MRVVISSFLAVAVFSFAVHAQAPQGPPPGPPPAPRAAALIDITGNWVSVINEDWRWRMVTPPKGDFASVPLNAEGRKVGNQWDAAKDEANGDQCKAYGAAGIMRLPTRLRISWVDDQTLKIETDAGMQTRLFHFGPFQSQGGAPQWQGDSVASWEKQLQIRGFGGRFGGPSPGKGGTMKVVTTHMRAGYLRKNGVPYSQNARLTEYFDRVEVEGVPYLIVTSVMDDPEYLTETFITSEQFKWEPDGTKWSPAPCRAR